MTMSNSNSNEKYYIYQITEESAGLLYEDIAFESLQRLKAKNVDLSSDNYSLVYSGERNGKNLDDIFTEFNLNIPSDFTGHSISVSDVIVFETAKGKKAFYVDSFDFPEVPQFLEHDNSRFSYLTGLPVSEEMLDVIKRLSKGEDVSLDEINNLPEIVTAFSNVDYSRPTIEIEGRDEIRENVLQIMDNYGSVTFDDNGKEHYNGSVESKGRLDIVTGLPASGKSSVITNRISMEYKSKVIDNDECKKHLPAYNNGWGSNVVHAESKLISDAAFRLAIDGKENIVFGSDANTIYKAYIEPAMKQGYKVYIHYVEVEKNIALGRQLERFIDTGKFQNPAIIFNYDNPTDGNKCKKAFEELKRSCNGYTHWDNNVSRDEKPILLEVSDGMTGEYLKYSQQRKELKNEKKLQPKAARHEQMGDGTNRTRREGLVRRSENDGKNGHKKDEQIRSAESNGASLSVKEKFKATFFIGKTEHSVFGTSIADCISKIRKLKYDAKKTSRCYVRKYDSKLNAYIADGAYLIKDGKSIPLYLQSTRESQLSKLEKAKDQVINNSNHYNPKSKNDLER